MTKLWVSIFFDGSRLGVEQASRTLLFDGFGLARSIWTLKFFELFLFLELTDFGLDSVNHYTHMVVIKIGGWGLCTRSRTIAIQKTFVS